MALRISLLSSLQICLFDVRILCATLCMPSLLYTQDYDGRLPSSITLPNGANEVHNGIPTCVKSRGCNFGYNWASGAGGLDFSYSTANGGSSTLTINAKMPAETHGQTSLFYFENLTIGNNSKLIINDFYSFTVNKGITLNPHSSLEVSLQKGSGNTSSQFYLTDNTSINLAQGSKFVIQNGDLFISNGSINIENQATLDINSTNIRLHTSLSNKGTLNLKGDLWAIGTTGVLTSPATTKIENYGTLNLAGNFHNGGTLNTIYKEQGAGQLLNYGGSIHITGTLINQSEGGQHSSIEIYGGSLKVDGGMTNAADSSLIFGAYNGEFGELIGNVNNQGSIKVDIAGATLGKHTLFQGTLSGQQSIELLSQGGQNEFISFTQQGGTSIDIEKDTQAIASFTQKLSQNEQNIINAFEDNFSKLSPSSPQSIYTFGGSAFLTNLSEDINSSARALSTQAPSLSLWNMVANTTLPLIHQPSIQAPSFGIAPFMSNATSTHLSAPLYGASLNASAWLGRHFVSAFATYATSQGSSSLSATHTSLDSRAFLIGLYDTIPLQRLELSLLAYYGSSQHTSKREVFFDTSAFQSAFSYSELGIQTTLGYPLLYGRLRLKPFIGLDYRLGMQGAISESSSQNAPALSLQARQTNTLALLLGTQMQYYFGTRHILFAGANLQYALTPTPQITAYFGDLPLDFKAQNTLGYALHIGGSVPLRKHISLSLYALYAHSYTQFNTYSGSVNLSYHF